MVALVVYDTQLEAYPEGCQISVSADTEIIHVFVFDSHAEAERAREDYRNHVKGFVTKIMTVDEYDWSSMVVR